ncbi:MAG: phosphotransferase [Leifsonia sp.]|uniref:maltokinase N-terminal cap-like domain-containing protein n=1 Tax=Microcella indica TaxID=2750620 RepID=UPI000C66DFEE|nr:phosphotransferase [Microcella indica]MBR23181.1 phosphotransferase [Leifsonia sp.]
MDSTTECLTDWMTRQRWYAGKGRIPQLVEVFREEWQARAVTPHDGDPSSEPAAPATSQASDNEDARIIVLLVRDLANNPPSLYHVPMVERSTIPKGAGPYLIGRTDDDRYLFDGAFDPLYTTELLHRLSVTRADTRSRVHGGEQSNTSIIYDQGSEAAVVAKIFRLVHTGENPDVTLQTALTSAGYRSVPRMLGYLSGAWHDPYEHEERSVGHLAFAQEFIPGVQDGWQIALQSSADGEDFTAHAERLGRTTAEVHTGLAACLPTREATLGDIVGFVAGWHQRLAIATSDVPELRALRPAIEAVYDSAQDAPWPKLQRIHGDYHLGQVLRRPSGEWLLVDFEGEPLRPLSERTRADSPLRDVAGMLRSFDYVVGARRNTAADEAARDAVDPEWARAARAGFLDGYIAESEVDLRAHRQLLDAFELDKAVYEAMYEARNRPAWLPIPLAGIRYLVSEERLAARR